jgi:hypothetical protein
MKKSIVLFLTFCFFINGFVPRSLFSISDTDAVVSLFENQPILHYYFSLSAVPIKIVSKLLTENNAFGTSNNEKRPAHKEKSGASQSSEFSLLTGERNVQKNCSMRTKCAEGNGFPAVYAKHGSFDALQYLPSAVPIGQSPGACFFLFLILMIGVFLPRGSLDANAILNIFNMRNPILRNSDRVFSLSAREGL